MDHKGTKYLCRLVFKDRKLSRGYNYKVLKKESFLIPLKRITENLIIYKRKNLSSIDRFDCKEASHRIMYLAYKIRQLYLWICHAMRTT